jgi:hypothetical protein
MDCGAARLLPLLPLLLVALTARGATADPYSEFRVPAHSEFSWVADFSGAAQMTDRSDPYSRRKDGGSSGRLNTVSYWRAERDHAVASLQLHLGGNGARSHQVDRYQYAMPGRAEMRDAETSASNITEEWSIGGEQRWYPALHDFNFAIRGSGSGRTSQFWSARVDRLVSTEPPPVRLGRYEESRARRTYDTAMDVGAGVGVGRVRNATGVYEARVLVQRLAAAGVLARPLSAAAQQRLADLMYVRGRFAEQRDHPAEAIWAEIERILEADGALPGRLAPGALWRATAPLLGTTRGIDRTGLPASPIIRSAGTLATLDIRSRHVRHSRREHHTFYSSGGTAGGPQVESRWSYDSSSKSTDDHVELVLAGSHDRPLGDRWQVGASAFTIAPVRRNELWMRWTVAAGASWIVADRWLSGARVSYDWFDERRTTGPTRADQARWTASATLDYYLRDATALRLGIEHSDSWYRGTAPSVPGSAHQYSRGTGVTVGISHRFMGRFHAPATLPGFELPGRDG